MKSKFALLLPLHVLLLASLACSLFAPSPPPPSPVPTHPIQETTATSEPAGPQPSPSATYPPPPPASKIYAPAFADYPAVAVRLPGEFGFGYSLPVSLGDVTGLDLVELTPGQQERLLQNGFVVAPPVPGQYQQFYQAYEAQRYLEAPVFVTTDAVYHIYHLIFDKLLRDLERDYLVGTLETLTHTMLQATQAQYESLRGTDLEEPARRNLAYFAVAAQLLGLSDPVPTAVQDLTAQELALIQAGAGTQVSPIWDRSDLAPDQKLIEDYSQYIPRGHYTRSEQLQRYFRAMMWYGRLTFRLRDPFETQRALLIVQALHNAAAPDGAPAVELWQRIYEPTTFIVGKSDDLSYQEYGALADYVYGENFGLEALNDSTRLIQFRQVTRDLPPPQVNSMWVWITEDKADATLGFRFMGQRFTLDQYVFDELTYREVGTEDKPRGLPMALDFFAALGSEEALGILDGLDQTQYANYPEQMAKLRTEIAALGEDSWTQNLYWAWLYAFQPLIEPKDARYPAFMRTPSWTRKELQTATASWTELKHDTLLYSKQVMAEMGGGGPDEPPKGYVEPNPQAYARLSSLAQMTYSGLEARGLLTDLTRGNLENLIDLLNFLQRIAEAELAGEQIVEDDYWRIQFFGGELEALTLASSDCDGNEFRCVMDLSDQKSPLVADVATGFNPNGELLVLEEGVGHPALIYVVLPDEPYRVAVGAVYSHYEFTVSPDERMTDETWQALIESGANPPQPAWTEAFITP